jgi:hypothetical protein
MGDLFLDAKNILHFVVVHIRPELKTVSGVYQLGRYSQPVAGTAHRSLQHNRYVERLTDLAHVVFAEHESRCSGCHPEAFDFGQGIQNFLGHTFTEINCFQFRIRRDAVKRQYRDRHPPIETGRFPGLPIQSMAEIGNGDTQQADEHDADGLVPAAWRRLRRCGATYNATRGQIEKPGENDNHRKARESNYNHTAQQALRQFQRRGDDVGELHYGGCNNGIGYRASQHAAVAQLCQKLFEHEVPVSVTSRLKRRPLNNVSLFSDPKPARKV